MNKCYLAPVVTQQLTRNVDCSVNLFGINKSCIKLRQFVHNFVPLVQCYNPEWVPMWTFWGLLPCSRVPQQCTESVLAPSPDTRTLPKFHPQVWTENPHCWLCCNMLLFSSKLTIKGVLILIRNILKWCWHRRIPQLTLTPFGILFFVDTFSILQVWKCTHWAGVIPDVPHRPFSVDSYWCHRYRSPVSPTGFTPESCGNITIWL